MSGLILTADDAATKRAREAIIEWLRWVPRQPFIRQEFALRNNEATAGRVLCAVADMLEAGVDIEELRKAAEGLVPGKPSNDPGGV